MPERQIVPNDRQEELLHRLDEELARLPDKFRVPIVLCDLEGRSRKEVAHQLKIPEGTLSSRLTTARRLLAKRLTRRGLAISGGALAMAVSREVASASVPTTLVSSTVKAATLTTAGLVSAQVASLTQGVLKTMFLTKLKTVVVLVVAGLALGGSSLSYWTLAAEDGRSAPQDVMSNRTPEARPASGKRLVHRVYSLAGLSGPQPPTDAEVALIVRVIVKTIEPKSWDEHGGEGAMAYVPQSSSLVIDQSPDIQEKIQGFLEKIGENKIPKEKKEKKKIAQASPRDETPGGSIRIAPYKPYKYPEIFKQVLAVMAEHFEVITYANQYDGRIQARTEANRAGIIRRASVSILALDDGSFAISAQVNKIRSSDDNAEVVGRDTELEYLIQRLGRPLGPPGSSKPAWTPPKMPPSSRDAPKEDKGKPATLPNNSKNY